MQLYSEKIGSVLLAKPFDRRMDASMAVEFKQKMAALIEEGHSLVVLDMESVDFIDSSGLGAIVSSLKAIGREGDLVISGLHPTVLSMFKLTRMDRVFRLFQSKDEAVAALSG